MENNQAIFSNKTLSSNKLILREKDVLITDE